MFNPTKAHQREISPGQVRIRMGNRVPTDAVSLGYSFAPPLNSEENVLVTNDSDLILENTLAPTPTVISMWPDSNNLLQNSLKKAEIDSRLFMVTNVYKDGVPLFYAHVLRYYLYDKDGPTTYGLYKGQGVAVVDKSGLNNHKYLVGLLKTPYTDSYHLYSVIIYTNFQIKVSNSIKAIYNGVEVTTDDSGEVTALSNHAGYEELLNPQQALKPVNTLEDVINPSDPNLPIYYPANAIEAGMSKVYVLRGQIEDTRTPLNFTYQVGVKVISDGSVIGDYLTPSISASVLNEKSLVGDDFSQYTKGRKILDSRLARDLVAPYVDTAVLATVGAIKQYYVKSNYEGTIDANKLEVRTRPDGNGHVLAKALVDTGIVDLPSNFRTGYPQELVDVSIKVVAINNKTGAETVVQVIEDKVSKDDGEKELHVLNDSEFSITLNNDYDIKIVPSAIEVKYAARLSVNGRYEPDNRVSFAVFNSSICKVVAVSNYSTPVFLPTYSIRMTDRQQVKVLPPVQQHSSESWYPRIQAGRFDRVVRENNTNVTYTYFIPEYFRQNFSSVYGLPYMDVTDEPAVAVANKRIKLRHSAMLVELDENNYPVNMSVKVNDVPMPIVSWDVSEGTVDLVGSVRPNDIITASYTYKETCYIYRGFWDKVRRWLLDLNPGNGHLFTYKDPQDDEIKQVPGFGLTNKTIYFYLKPAAKLQLNVNGNWDIIAGTFNPDPLFHSFAPVNDVNALLIGKVRVRPNSSYDQIKVLDARVRGGGLKEEISKAMAEELGIEVSCFWDEGYWDGEPYPENAVLVVKIPKEILTEYGGRFQKNEVETIVEKYMAFGTFYIIEYQDVNSQYGNDDGLTSNLKWRFVNTLAETVTVNGWTISFNYTGNNGKPVIINLYLDGTAARQIIPTWDQATLAWQYNITGTFSYGNHVYRLGILNEENPLEVFSPTVTAYVDYPPTWTLVETKLVNRDGWVIQATYHEPENDPVLIKLKIDNGQFTIIHPTFNDSTKMWEYPVTGVSGGIHAYQLFIGDPHYPDYDLSPVITVEVISAIVFPTIATLPQTGWPKYARDNWGSSINSLTPIDKPYIDWVWELADDPANNGWDSSDDKFVVGPDETIYITNYQQDQVWAIDKNGVKWTWGYNYATSTGIKVIRGTPLLTADGTLYVHISPNGNAAFPRGGVAALNAADGTLKWTYAVPDTHGTYSPKTTYPQAFAVTPDNGIIVLLCQSSTSTGAPEYRYRFYYNDPTVYCLNSDGTLRWRVFAGNFDQYMPNTAVVSPEGIVYVANSNLDDQDYQNWREGDPPLYGMRITAIDQTDGTILWTSNEVYPGDPICGQFDSMILGPSGTIYAEYSWTGETATSMIYAFDAATGAEKWHWTCPELFGNTGMWDQQALTMGPDESLYIAYNVESYSIIYALNPDGTDKWQLSTGLQGSGDYSGSVWWAWPCSGDGTLYVYLSGVEEIQALDCKDGSIKWRWNCSDSLMYNSHDLAAGGYFNGLALGEGALYAVFSSTKIVCFKQGTEPAPPCLTQVHSGQNLTLRPQYTLSYASPTTVEANAQASNQILYPVTQTNTAGYRDYVTPIVITATDNDPTKRAWLTTGYMYDYWMAGWTRIELQVKIKSDPTQVALVAGAKTDNGYYTIGFPRSLSWIDDSNYHWELCSWGRTIKITTNPLYGYDGYSGEYDGIILAPGQMATIHLTDTVNLNNFYAIAFDRYTGTDIKYVIRNNTTGLYSEGRDWNNPYTWGYTVTGYSYGADSLNYRWQHLLVSPEADKVGTNFASATDLTIEIKNQTTIDQHFHMFILEKGMATTYYYGQRPGGDNEINADEYYEPYTPTSGTVPYSPAGKYAGQYVVHKHRFTRGKDRNGILDIIIDGVKVASNIPHNGFLDYITSPVVGTTATGTGNIYVSSMEFCTDWTVKITNLPSGYYIRIGSQTVRETGGIAEIDGADLLWGDMMTLEVLDAAGNPKLSVTKKLYGGDVFLYNEFD